MPTIGRKCLAFLLTASLLLSMVGTVAAESRPGGPPASPFWDTYGTQFQQAVDSLYALGVVSGKTETAFDPNGRVTRAEMASLVIRALGMQSNKVTGVTFPDVPAGHWAAQAVAQAASEGIIRGGEDGEFHPNDPVTYPQVVAMLTRATGLEQRAGGYPTGYVLLANELGLVEGTAWGLDKNATRGDVALMLYKTIFEVPRGGTGATLSQTLFKRAGSIEILPDIDVVSKGTIKLTGSVLDWVGKPLELPVRWTAGDPFGSISADGTLTVSDNGPITVQATAGGLTASRTFTVIQSLTVKTSAGAVKAGAQVQLSAVGKTSGGTEIQVTPVWSVELGSGLVDENGVLTVQGSQPVRVRAAVGTLTAETTVSVVGGITISPTTAQVAPNGEVQFTATTKDAAGNQVAAPVSWSVSGGGTIDENGKYRAGDASATVTVKSGDRTASAKVNVVNRLEVSPNEGAFRSGESKQFTANVYSSGGQQVPAAVEWRVDPPGLGIISSTGTFFGAKAGSGYVIASFGGLTTRVPVSVAGQATGIRLSASPSTVPANGRSKVTITATLVDALGNPASGAENVMFAVNNTRLGTLDKSLAKVEHGVATATLSVGTASGTYTIYASAPGSSIAGTTMYFTTTPPTISHVALEAYPSTMATGGGSQTTVTAKLIDNSGSEMVNNTSQSVVVYLNSADSSVGRLSSHLISIGVGQSSGSVSFTSSGTPGTTPISGTSTYMVQSTTITSQTVGEAYRLRISPVTETAKANGDDEATVKVEIQDANGNVRTGDNQVMVALSATSGANSITIPSQQTQWGVATFHLRTTKAGTYSLSAWAVGKAFTSDTSEVTYTAGLPSKLQLVVEPAATIAADGISVATLKARILDANGNLVESASNVVRFVRDEDSDNVTVQPTSALVTAVSGIASYPVTAKTSIGSDTFHAESDGLTTSADLTINTTITGVPVKVAVQSLTQSKAKVGQLVTVQVWVLDGNFPARLVTGDSGRMVYLMASNGAQVSAPTETRSGVATFTVTPTRSGDVVLTANGDGLENDSLGRVLSVQAGVPDHIVLYATPEGLSADGVSRAYIKATLVDQYENPVNGAYTVNLSTSTGESLTLSSTSVTTGGQVWVTSKTTPGSTVITGTSTAYAVQPLTIRTYHAGLPSKVVLEEIPPIQAGNSLVNQSIVKARIVDENGNPVTSLNSGSELTAMALRIEGSSGSGNTTITKPNSSGLSGYGVYPNGSTVGSGTVTGGVATFTITNTRAETVTLTPVVFYRGMQLKSEPSQLTTTAGAATRLTVTASNSTVLSTSPTTVTLTASISDAFGNPTAAADDEFTFSTNSRAMISLPSGSTVPAVRGSASYSIQTQAYPAGGTATITVRSSRTGLVGSTSIVLDQLPEQPTISVRDSSGSDSYVSRGETGVRVSVTVPVRSSSQQVFAYVNGVSVTLYVSTAFDVINDTISPGNKSLVAYIQRSDLGGSGVKDIRIMIMTPLGMSPLSESGTVTVQ